MIRAIQASSVSSAKRDRGKSGVQNQAAMTTSSALKKGPVVYGCYRLFSRRQRSNVRECRMMHHQRIIHRPYKDASRAFTFASMRFLTARNASGGISRGSGICHSSRRFARTIGQASPQPIVTAAAYSPEGTS